MCVFFFFFFFFFGRKKWLADSSNDNWTPVKLFWPSSMNLTIFIVFRLCYSCSVKLGLSLPEVLFVVLDLSSLTWYLLTEGKDIYCSCCIQEYAIRETVMYEVFYVKWS